MAVERMTATDRYLAPAAGGNGEPWGSLRFKPGMMFRLLLCVCLATAPYAVAGSTTVYRTVNEQGVVGFSDTPPADPAAAEVIAVHPPRAAPAAESLQHLEAMRQTTERMAADRRERELERELARLRARVAAQPVRQPEPAVTRYQPVYLPVPVPGWRPGYPPRPPYRPELRPPRQLPGIIPGPNSQLMRPIVSDR